MASESAKHLLKIKERLSINLPGNQIYAVLGDLIFEAIRPIIDNTSFFDQAMCELLPMVYLNNRRKYSNLEHDVFADLLFSFIMSKNTSVKHKTLKACGIEKTIMFNLLERFLLLTIKYSSIYLDLLEEDDVIKRSNLNEELSRIEQTVGATKIGTLYSVIQTVDYYYNQAKDFKSMIEEKYIRLAYNETVKAMNNTKLQIDEDDLFHNLLLSVSKAIDKYDPNKGALTSYVKWWFMDGVNQSSTSHEYGTAFAVPNTQRKKMLNNEIGPQNLSVTLDDCEGISDPRLTDQDQSVILDQDDVILRRLLRHADTSGMAILALGISYTLDASEIQMLKDTMK